MVSAHGPSRAARPAGAHPASASAYRVRRGDTLSELARRFGLSVRALQDANPSITDPNLIFAGQELVVPAPPPRAPPREAPREVASAPRPAAPAASLRPAPRRRPDAHTVQRGDTVWGLARRYGLSERAILAENPGVEPRRLQIGQTLRLPRPEAGGPARPRPADPMQARLQAQLPPRPAPTAPARADAPGAPAGIEAAAPRRSEPRGDRLVGAVQNAAVDLVVGEDLELERTLELGAAGTAEARWSGEIRDDGRRTAEQRAFEAEARGDGQEVLWLESEGTLALDLERARGPAELELDGELRMTTERPHAYPEGRGDPAALARAAAETALRPPLDGEAARALERGARFELEGELAASARRDGDALELEAGVTVAARLEVERGSGEAVDVTLATSRNLDLLDARAEDDPITARLEIERDRGTERRYRLDLGTPEGRAAYDALARFEAPEPGPGVRRLSERETWLRREAGELEIAQDPLTARVEAERVDDERRLRTTVGGELEATRSREGTTLTGAIEGERGRVEDRDTGRVTETERGEARLDARGTGDLTWSAGALAERERVVTRDEDRGTVVRTGALEGRGSLAPEVGEAELGFGAEARARYRLQTPLDAPAVALPLDAERAEALPEGSRFEIRGEGELRAELERTPGRLELEGERELAVIVARGAAREVTVTVDASTRAENAREAEWAGEDGEWRLGYTGEGERTTRRVGRYDLDLGDPRHREAYDRLVTGDTGPADALGLRERPRDEDRTTDVNALEGEAHVTEWLGVTAEISRADLDPADFRVRRDAERRAFTDAQTAAGREVRWLELEASVSPRAAHALTDPVTAGITPRLEAEAGGRLAFSALVPSVDGEAPSVAPPLTAEAARDLPRGSEVLLEREGDVSTALGARAGYALSAPGVEVGASAELRQEASAEASTAIRVRRLDDARVEVSLEDGTARAHAVGLALRAGAELDTAALAGVDVPLVTDRADEAVNRWLQVELSAERETRDETRREVRFVLDLERPEARAAYEELVAARPDRALALADRARAGDDRGVRVERGVETRTETERSEIGLRIGPDHLFMSRALRSDSTRIERREGDYERRDTSRYEEERRGLLGRERDVDWQAVWVRTDEEPEGRGFYRMTFTDDDPITGRAQIERALHLADALDTEPARPVRVERAGRRGLAALLGDASRHGETRAELDVFLTERGVERLGQLDAEDAYAAYAEVLVERGALDKTPGWARPDIGAEARAALDRAREIEASPFYEEREDQQRVRSEEVRYWRLTGENVWEEDRDYETARAFADMVGRIDADRDPAAWGRAFADLGEQTRFDMYDALAALGQLVGGDELVVNRLALQGPAVDIEMRSEGILSEPN